MQMKKRNTTNRRRKLAPETERIIRGSYGFRALIAKVGGFKRPYVTKVVNGTKPPSRRFLEALARAHDVLSRRATSEIVRREVDSVSCGPREMGAR